MLNLVDFSSSINARRKVELLLAGQFNLSVETIRAYVEALEINGSIRDLNTLLDCGYDFNQIFLLYREELQSRPYLFSA